MTPFTLKIVTPDGERFNGNAEELVVRTVSGDLGILAGHINTVAPLGMGQALVVVNGECRFGTCDGGMVSVLNGSVTLLTTSFQWTENNRA